MATRERAVDRGTARGSDAVRNIGREIRLARRSRGLSLAAVAGEARLSASELSRLERGLVRGAGVVTLARLCAIVGLDLVARAYPGGTPIRDARHAALLGRFRALLHASVRFSLEVPLPDPADQRAWDAMATGSGWRYGIEAEMNPTDGQATLRRLTLKRRDGMVDGVILLLPDTRQTRLFRRDFAELLTTDYPVRPASARASLAQGRDPGDSAVLVM